MPVNNTIQSRGPFPQGLLLQKPQVNLIRSSSTRMWLVSLCAGITILQSALTDAFSSLFIALAAVSGALLTEFLIDDISMRRFIREGGRSRENQSGTYRDGSAITSALVLTLLLPNTIHPLFAFLGAVFAMLALKHSFGGLGTNWVNPALGAWLFIRFSWPGSFSAALMEFSPDVLAANLQPVVSAGSFDAYWTSLLNRTIFSLTSSELPGGYIGLLVYSGTGIIADRGVLALLAGTIIITAGQVSRFWIPLAYLGVYSLLVRFAGGGDMLFGLFSGGTLAAAFILASDPATGPKSSAGLLIAAFLGGILNFVFRYLGFEPYGAFFAVTVLNALTPLFRYFETRFLFAGGIHAKH
ncbi:hypothetical protein AGMMS4952_18830 [Spirochaetia bacterium]|nr:hypothetical protein AGMMS4952_18830 [Spirochaetia bacterium]